MSAVAFIRRMVESGFSYEDALRAAEAFETTAAEMLPVRPSKRQERNRRYYQNRKASEPSEKRLKASEPSETSESSESDQKVSPKPPSKNTSSSAPKGASSPPLTAETLQSAETVWQTANPASRTRSGRPATRKAVAAALTDGATEAALVASVRDHCRRSGEHSKGVHRIIEAELWREAVPKPEPPPAKSDPAYRAHLEAHFRATGEWKPEWGERPKLAA